MNKPNSKGFTLIEIVIVVGIMAIAAGIAIGLVGTSFHSQSKNEAAKLMGAIKYAYNEAVTKNLYFRLVFDLEKQSYWLESSEQSFFVEKETEEVKKEREKKAKEKERKKDNLNIGDEEVEPADPVFAEVDPEETTVKMTKLDKSVLLKDVYIEHQEKPEAESQAYLYFFPRGLTELAIINLTDENEESFMSIIVNPITGRCKIKREYVEFDKMDE